MRLFPPCTATAGFQCGNFTANGTDAYYRGLAPQKLPWMLFSKGLSQGCGQGVFVVTGGKRLD